jgi:hypothetical protein
MSLETSRLRITGVNLVNGAYELQTERQTIMDNILFIPGLYPYNLVDAAQAATPVNELWTMRNGTTSFLILVPFNETQAYYYDIVNVGDDCMVIRNCYRRLYTRPTPTTISQSTIESQVKNATNLEVAIRCRKNGTAHNYRFFPQHESVNTCFLDGSRTFTRNGVSITTTEAAYVASQTATVEARYNVIHPEEANPLASLLMRHTITAQKIRAQVEIEFLQETQIDVGYSIMNNVTLTPKSAAVGVGRQTIPVTLTGENQAAPNQGRLTNCAMGQTGDSTVLLADWSGNLSSVLASQSFVNPSLVQWFIASSSKFYNQPFFNCVIPAGQSFAWRGEWRMAEWASLFS